MLTTVTSRHKIKRRRVKKSYRLQKIRMSWEVRGHHKGLVLFLYSRGERNRAQLGLVIALWMVTGCQHWRMLVWKVDRMIIQIKKKKTKVMVLSVRHHL